MKKYNEISSLENYGLQNLSKIENEEVNGGFAFLIFGLGLLATSIGFVAKKSTDDWQCFKDGLFGKPSAHDSSHKE